MVKQSNSNSELWWMRKGRGQLACAEEIETRFTYQSS